jgi:hypothetical protein
MAKSSGDFSGGLTVLALVDQDHRTFCSLPGRLISRLSVEKFRQWGLIAHFPAAQIETCPRFGARLQS